MWSESGRSGRPSVCFTPFGLPAFLQDPTTGLGQLLQESEQLHEMGVDWLALSVPGDSRAEMAAAAQRLAEGLALRSRP